MINTEHFPGMSNRELLLSMTPDQIVEHIMMLGEKATRLEKEMNEAGEILESSGYTFNDVLQERENGNKK